MRLLSKANARLGFIFVALSLLNILLRWRRRGLQGSLLDELQAGGAFTLFAPTAEAFPGWQPRGQQHQDALSRLLADHVLRGVYLVEDVPPDGLQVMASSGRPVFLSLSPKGGLLVDGLSARHTNLEAGDGIVHVIDGVLGQDRVISQRSAIPSSAANQECSGHGARDTGGVCLCSALYTGTNCQAVKAADVWQHGFHGYSGAIVLNQAHLSSLQELRAVTPLKELKILSPISPQVRAQLNSILPVLDPFGLQTYQSCALVGGSGILLRNLAGKEIDSHEMVVRFNSAPTKAYEQHVGIKTTYRICNGEHVNFREGDEVIIHHLKTVGAVRPPLMFDPDFTSYVSQSSAFIPSSGYFAIMMALQICRRITLYGFYASDRHGARHHYFNDEVPSNTKRDDTEYKLAAALARAGLLCFAESCTMECHQSQASCQECIGDVPMEVLAARERWTDEQLRANSVREAAWQEASRWDWGVEEEYTFSEKEGVMTKPVKPPKPDRSSDAAVTTRSRQRSSREGPRRPAI